MTKLQGSVVAGALLAIVGSAAAQTLGTTFTYQGQLRDSGSPANGTYDLTFALHDQSAGGTQQGPTVCADNVTIAEGLFTLELDFGAQFTGDQRFLEIAVRADTGLDCGDVTGFVTLAPRQVLTATPYALALPGLYTRPNATSPNVIGGHSANSVAPGVVGATIGGGGNSDFANLVTDDYGTVGGGIANTVSNGYATVGGGVSSVASGHRSTVAGGGINMASGYGSTVAGGEYNTASGASSTVGGGYSNAASAGYGTVGGGNANAAGYLSTVGGGFGNEASGWYGAIGGGYANAASDSYSTVGGGWNNTVSNLYGAVGGGAYNTASGASSTVGGGYSNMASGGDDTVGGGHNNTASSPGSTVGGGWENTASGPYGTVGGGVSNAASGDYSTVGGGVYNEATDYSAAVGGGYGNTASGDYSTVSGGRSNQAGGDYSFAGGRQAQVRDPNQVGGGDADGDQGTFVWADSTAANFVSTGPDQFLIRASGGVGIGTNGPDTTLHVGTGADASLASGSGYALLGTAAGANIVMDNDEIMARNNGAASTLWLNHDGGNVVVGNTTGYSTLHVEGATGYSGLRVRFDNNTKLIVNDNGSTSIGSSTVGPTNGLRVAGDCNVIGTLTKGGGSFKIDHPLDPENYYLYHSFVESPDMKNIYDGVAITDQHGYATVTLPAWFEALNRDFRYQLTVLEESEDDFILAKVYRKMADNRFVIKTSLPNVEVSWQVTGTRKDAWAEQNRIPVEVEKEPANRGRYLHSEAFGLPANLSVDAVPEPEAVESK